MLEVDVGVRREGLGLPEGAGTHENCCLFRSSESRVVGRKTIEKSGQIAVIEFITAIHRVRADNHRPWTRILIAHLYPHRDRAEWTLPHRGSSPGNARFKASCGTLVLRVYVHYGWQRGRRVYGSCGNRPISSPPL